MRPTAFLRDVFDRIAGWPLLLAWLALILALSSIPSTPKPPSEVPYDKLAHLAIYGVLGFIVGWMLRRRTGAHGASVIAMAALLCVAWGAGDEIYQSSVPGRDPSLADLAADFAGALSGAACAVLIDAITAPPPR